jgi:hypothetical protein
VLLQHAVIAPNRVRHQCPVARPRVQHGAVVRHRQRVDASAAPSTRCSLSRCAGWSDARSCSSVLRCSFAAHASCCRSRAAAAISLP